MDPDPHGSAIILPSGLDPDTGPEGKFFQIKTKNARKLEITASLLTFFK